MEVNIHDQMSRLHVLRLEFPSDYPQSSPASFCALPVATQVRWDWKRRLEGLVQDYGKVLEKYQNLWNNLDDLDEHTWIVEPECPNRSGSVPQILISPGICLSGLLTLLSESGFIMYLFF